MSFGRGGGACTEDEDQETEKGDENGRKDPG
jgi:hypothetical protein